MKSDLKPNQPLLLNSVQGPLFTLKVENDGDNPSFSLLAGVKSSSLLGSTSIATSPHTKISLIAQETIQIYKAVTVRGYLVQETEESFSSYAGLALQTVAANTTFDGAKDGLITNPNWAWIAGFPVYLSSNGDLTQSLTVFPFRRIGFAVTPTQLNLDPFGFLELASAQW